MAAPPQISTSCAGQARARGRPRSIALAAAIAAVTAIAFPTTGSPSGSPLNPTFGYGPYAKESHAIGYCRIFAARIPRYRACVIRSALRLVIDSRDSADELPRIDRYVHSVGGWLEPNCHVLMHAVGRRYGRLARVSLTDLLDYLPKTNDPGCSAGFAHGLLTYLGPQIVQLGPAGAAADCHRARTRYQRYSCIHGLGHAYARLFLDSIDPALASCRALGPADAPDCAQGVFHDYWIALSGLDNAKKPAAGATTPRALCGAQPPEYVRACWYRAYLERPPAHAVRTAADELAVCSGLAQLQHSACVTAASLISSTDPFEQLTTCSRLRGDDAAACVRGIRVPGVAGAPLDAQLRLIRGCADVDHAAQRACYEWLGRTLNVVANGAFGRVGCPELAYAATRDDCARGAAAYEGALETFS
jgi:hypothetical protein